MADEVEKKETTENVAVPATNQATEKWNTLSIVGLILSVVLGIVGSIVSIIALLKINKTHEKGKVLAIIGIVVGVISTLTILPAIGALAYFGVLSPTHMLPASCTVGAGFGCTNYHVSSFGQVDIEMRNNMGATINDVTFSMAGECEPKLSEWANGKAQTFTCTVVPIEKSKPFSSGFDIAYTKDGISHQVEGRLTSAKVD